MKSEGYYFVHGFATGSPRTRHGFGKLPDVMLAQAVSEVCFE